MKRPSVILKILTEDRGFLGSEGKWLLRSLLLVFALITPSVGHTEDNTAEQSERLTNTPRNGLEIAFDGYDQYLQAHQSVTTTHSSRWQASTLLDTDNRQADGVSAAPDEKDYLLPAAEIVAFNLLLNRFNYYFIDSQVYGSSLRSVRNNVSTKWIVDTDPFSVNQFLHPYQGSVYFGLARSSGLDYWESMAYTFGGSLLWEIAGETGLPSINDLVTTGFAGPFLGEPLFRMASLVLEGGGETPGFWREVGAAIISPPLGFTRLAFGERYRKVFDSRDPAIYSYVRVGWNQVDNVFDDLVSQKIEHVTATVDFHMSYGLPGKNGYTYTRPFDYFDFEFTATTANTFENIMSRGLLLGKEYAAGENYRGVWGLYGSYDYISPQTFRISSTALSFGTTAQWWLSKTVALQGTALAGLGYGAAGTIHGSGDRDYHYGATPQALVALRLLFGERANLDLSARSYLVSNVFSTENRGTERIFRGDVALTMRVHGPHALTLKYNISQRNAQYPDIADTRQRVQALSLLYTYSFGDRKFGAVEWRNANGQ